MGAGHRRRTISRVVHSQEAYPHDLLECLLFRACPRKDMYDCATALLQAFGSLDGVFSASLEELCAVEGVGENVARYLQIVGLCLKRAHGADSFGFARSTAEFSRLPILKDRAIEGDSLELFAIDKDGRVRMVIPIEKGERTEKDMLKKLLPVKAEGVFALRCNGGVCSDAEDELCAIVQSVCKSAYVKLFDYCINTANGFYSFYVEDKITGGRT